MATPSSNAAPVALAGAELWLDDLYWHRRMHGESRFWWTAEHAMDIVMRRTGGRLDYTTIADLRWLQTKQDDLATHLHQCRASLAAPLATACEDLTLPAIADAVGLDVEDCLGTLRRVKGLEPTDCTNRDVRQVLHQLPCVNPLIEMWELRQLVALYEAAHDLLEDTLADLLLELMPGHTDDELWEATGKQHAHSRARVDLARVARGAPGDARRRPTQRY